MESTPLTVTTPGGSYPVVVGAGVLADLPSLLDQLGLHGRMWLISDSQVFPRHGASVEQRLRAAGYAVQSTTVPAGEQSKDLATSARLYDWLIGGGVERRDTVLALGGGVIGDLAGFVAATVLRGIAVVQLPTTLLAMVDSAIGGKTGVNHPLGKNLIGAFHQPRLVLSDTDTLRTLPERELRAGWAEVIKHGVIKDAGLFEQLEARAKVGHHTGTAGAIDRFVPDELSAIIRRAARVKVNVVNADERESGERILLNYGHTLGHALEASTGYGALLHGEAVAIGMGLAAQIAHRLGMCDRQLIERQRRLLQAFGLPTELPEHVQHQALLQRTVYDKKVQAGRVRWVLPTAIGAAIVRTGVPEELVSAVLEAASTSSTHDAT